MSIDRYTYVGPYIECSGSKTTIKMRDRIVCSSGKAHSFSANGDTKFCGVCGAPVEYTYKDEPVTFWDIIYQESDEFYEKHFEAIVPKSMVPLLDCELNPITPDPMSDEYDIFGLNCGVYVDHDESTTELNASEIVSSIDEVKEVMKKELDLLRNLYENVEVKFGVVSYCR